MIIEYIKAMAADAEMHREAMGRAYAKLKGIAYPIPGYNAATGISVPGVGETLYLVDYDFSEDRTEVAFSVNADVLAVMGMTVQVDGADVEVPTVKEALADEWFERPVLDE